jgi:hypothetical protein
MQLLKLISLQLGLEVEICASLIEQLKVESMR